MKTVANRLAELMKFPLAVIQEELRRLGVADVAADVADGFVDVAVGHDEIDRAIEVGIEKGAAESQRIL